MDYEKDEPVYVKEFIQNAQTDSKENMLNKVRKMIKDGSLLRDIKSEINKYRTNYIIQTYSYIDEFKDLVDFYWQYFKFLDPKNIERKYKILTNEKIMKKNTYKIRYLNPISYVLGLLALTFDNEKKIYKIDTNEAYKKIIEFQKKTLNQVSVVDIYRYSRYWIKVLLKS